MSTLADLAEEYLQNVAALERRIAELKALERHTVCTEERLRLRRRISLLYTMAGEGRQLAFQMKHYYDKPEEVAYARKSEPRRTRKRVKFRQSGYGAPTPALAMHGRNAHSAPISGLRAQLSRGYAAGRNRQ